MAASLSAFRYQLPLVRPLPLSGQTVTVREGLLVRLEEDGHTGWGDVAPLPGFSTETVEDAITALRSLGGSVPLAADAPLDPALPPSVRFGLDVARWSLQAADATVSVSRVLAKTPAASVPLNGLLSGTPEAVLADAARLADAGYPALKLKVGRGDLTDEAALVRRIHAAHPTVALRLDANRAWSYDDAHRFADALGATPIEYIEEPLADPAQLGDLAGETGLPIALDESVTAMAVSDLDAHAYAVAVVLKPSFLGGTRAWSFAERARDLGMRVTWSAAFESGVGLQGLVAMAAASGTPEAPPTPAGLDTYRWLAADVFVSDASPLPLGQPLVDVAQTLAPRAIDLDRLTPVAL
ncbi:MAG: o-succinylbenzoate synthase [Bacteroidota bacterium]